MIETSSDLSGKSFATSVIFGNFRKMSSEACMGLKNHLENSWKFSESGRKSSKNRQLCLYKNKTIHVACSFGISLLVFNFLVRISRVSWVHSWDLTSEDIELKTPSSSSVHPSNKSRRHFEYQSYDVIRGKVTCHLGLISLRWIHVWSLDIKCHRLKYKKIGSQWQHVANSVVI